MSLRPATPDDAEALAALGARTFVETFVEGFGIPYPPADLAAFMAETFSPEATARGLADPRLAWTVSGAAGGGLAAFSVTGPVSLPHPEAKSGEGELKRLYVARAHQGAGHGSRLLEGALAQIGRDFIGHQWIGVWSGNLKAQRLYAAHGFEKAGGYRFPVGTWLDDEFILRRSPVRP